LAIIQERDWDSASEGKFCFVLNEHLEWSLAQGAGKRGAKTMFKLRRFQRLAMNGALAAGLTGCLTAMTLALTPSSVLAESLAEKATNPLGSLVQFQMIDQYNWETYNSDGPSNVFEIQPVIPIKLPFAFVPEVITRTTVPYVTTPKLGPAAPGGPPLGRHDGLGDTVMNLFGILNLGIEGVTIGVGPTFTFPTATSDFTGSGKWQAGPTFLAIVTKIPKVQYGVLAYQQWSFADADGGGRKDVSKLNLQPFFTKHFSGGWYAGSQDVPWTYNFKTDKWTMSMGPKVGRVFHIGKQPVNAFGAVYYSPLDDGASQKWTARVGLTLLFPE
jgi:hypothetical protein